MLFAQIVLPLEINAKYLIRAVHKDLYVNVHQSIICNKNEE